MSNYLAQQMSAERMTDWDEQKVNALFWLEQRSRYISALLQGRRNYPAGGSTQGPLKKCKSAIYSVALSIALHISSFPLAVEAKLRKGKKKELLADLQLTEVSAENKSLIQ